MPVQPGNRAASGRPAGAGPRAAALVGGYDGSGYDPDVLVTSDGRRLPGGG